MTEAVTREELPFDKAELVDGELLIMPQFMLMFELPPIVIPVLLALGSKVMTQYSSDPGTVAAMAFARMTGALAINIELKGRLR